LQHGNTLYICKGFVRSEFLKTQAIKNAKFLGCEAVLSGRNLRHFIQMFAFIFKEAEYLKLEAALSSENSVKFQVVT